MRETDAGLGVVGGGGAGVSLASLRRGEEGVVLGLGGLEGDEAAMLRAMGLGERVRVRMCREGEPVVVAVGTTAGRHCHCHGHCRIGLARGLAERVLVSVGVRKPGSGVGSGERAA